MAELLAKAGNEERGYPASQTERDTAEVTLAAFRQVPAVQQTLLTSLLARWGASRIKSEDWASMDSLAAKAWVRGVTALEVKLPLDAVHVTRGADGSKKRLRPIKNSLDPRSYGNEHGRYWIRFSDTRHRHRRKREVVVSPDVV